MRALIQGPGGLAWRHELVAAIRVLQHVLAPKFDSLADPLSSAGLAEGEALWAAHPGAWQTYIRQLLRTAVDKPALVTAADALVWHEDQGVPDEDPEEWLCMPCGRFFGSKAAVNMHMTRKHAKRCPVRAFVPTPACPVCHTCWNAGGFLCYL